MTTPPQLQFEQGLVKIHSSIENALDRKRVTKFTISHTTVGSTPRDSTFSVSANAQTREQMFTREESVDSALTLDSFASTKVRLLVSNFTG
jgi:hypothetical protein